VRIKALKHYAAGWTPLLFFSHGHWFKRGSKLVQVMASRNLEDNLGGLSWESISNVKPMIMDNASRLVVCNVVSTGI